MISFVFFVIFCKLASAAPLPAIITRYHVAPASTVTDTYVTGTTTVELPPVQILILNGATFTSTMTEGHWNTEPVTFTTYFKDVVQPEDPAPTPTPAATTEATTPAAEAPAPTTTAPTTSVESTPVDSPVESTPAAVKTIVTVEKEVVPTSPLAPVAAATETESSATGLISPPRVIVYSPYANDGSCKDASTIKNDLSLIKSKNINMVRLYGTDCLVFDVVLPTLSKLGMTADQGVYFNGGIDSVDAGVSQIIAYGKANGFGVFAFITVGNEAIMNNLFPVSDLISKISSVKATLRSNGYNGQVTTAEPPVSYELHPELCTQSEIDFVGINPHPYFDGSRSAEQAGDFIMGQKAIVEGICGGKSVSIVETGYPHTGNVNGKQVPTAENQAIAIRSMIAATGGDLTILTTFDDFWKAPGPYGIEQSFGSINLFN